ncbi:MAG: heparan-alpha-glucosaminide N-acetyltransferase domain-containing protein, partial [FCB group bacterium]|nr:heparan-alpha-glucosaminide N-acetyltransferase domain-containing protein [FCB group bacterium]
MSTAPDHRASILGVSSAASEIIIRCECGKECRAPATAFGSKGRCSLCGRVFTVTAENSAPAPVIQPMLTSVPERIAKRAAVPAANRIASLDQLRGYAIVGMFLVNYLGNFHALPWIIEHQRNSFSYADTIAPLFLFVVGMGFRLSVKRRA